MELKRRQERLVFVDPEDEEISYWWPAIIVPQEEYELFKETMDNDAGADVNENECLVCYFEDGSFSVAPKSSLIPFHPAKEPYKSYSLRLKHFLTDAGVRRATDFHNHGKIPKLFKWLKLSETGYLDPSAAESESDDDDDDDGENETEVEIEIVTERVKRPASSTTKSKDPAKKRGRKPKNQQINLAEDVAAAAAAAVISPKPMNPSEVMKIEALISAANSASQNSIKEQIASQ